MRCKQYTNGSINFGKNILAKSNFFDSTPSTEANSIKLKTSDLDDRLRARNAFRERGERISEWALTRGFNKHLVYSVLNGRTKGDCGQAHLIAVELGLKARPSPRDTKE